MESSKRLVLILLPLLVLVFLGSAPSSTTRVALDSGRSVSLLPPNPTKLPIPSEPYAAPGAATRPLSDGELRMAPLIQLTYAASLDPSGQCNTNTNCLLSVTSSSSEVLVTIGTSLVGSACNSPPCTSYNGVYSYQFNVVFPTYDVTPQSPGGFMLQDVIEVNLTSGTCYAHAQGGQAQGSPQTPLYNFPCGQGTLQGDNFGWTITSSSGYFQSTGFLLNGQNVYSEDSQSAFACAYPCVSMSDVYEQSVWVGADSAYSFASFASGAGSMDYTGMSAFSCPSCGTIIVTGEKSNMVYSLMSSSGSQLSQTYSAPPLTLSVTTDKSSYTQGERIQFSGSGFVPKGAIDACLSTNNDGSLLCVAEPNADSMGNVVGSMYVGTNIPPGPQKFYVKDMTTQTLSSPAQLAIGTTAPPAATSITLLPGSLSSQLTAGNAFTVTYVANGVTQTTEDSGGPVTVYPDPGTYVGISATSSGSSSAEEWVLDSQVSNAVVQAGSSATFAYYDLISQSVSYTIVDGGLPSPPSLTYSTAPSAPSAQSSTQQIPVVLSQSPQAIWALKGSGASVTSSISGEGGERWITQDYTWTLTGPYQIPVQVSYYHQFLVAADYAVVNGGNPTPPTISGLQFGNQFSASLAQSPTLYWLDAGAQWSLPNTLGGGTAQERWVTTQQTTGEVQLQTTVNPAYAHQYYLEVTLSPGTGGTVNTQSGWNDAGSTLQLTATADSGWKFEGWSGTGTGSSSAESNTTSIELSAPIQELAKFYPGLTMTSGSGGSISYVAGSAGQVQAGAGSTVYLPAGTTVALNESPSSFLYQFAGWTGAASGTNSSVSVTMSGPTSIGARFSYNYVNIGGIIAIVAVLAGAAGYMIRRKR